MKRLALFLVLAFPLVHALLQQHSRPVLCPCDVHFHYHPPPLDAHRRQHRFDFFILSHSNPAQPPLHHVAIRNATVQSPPPVFIAQHARFKIMQQNSSQTISSTRPSLTLVPVRQQCPIVLPTSLNPRIVGGNIPHSSLREHMVAFVANSNFVCSGSIISARWAVTAAHCRIDARFIALIGGASVGNGLRMPIQRVITHPRYNRNHEDSPNDIALVKFRTDVPQTVNFIRVNINASLPMPGAYSRASGYGRTREVRSRQSGPLLRQVDIPIISMPTCKNYYSKASLSVARRLSDRLQLCAGLMEGGCDACQGDSGGPLSVFDADGNIVLIGIVSFGIGCARENLPGAYTRISAFTEWMAGHGVEFIPSQNGTNIFAIGSETATTPSEFTPPSLTTTQKVLIGVGVLALVMVVAFFSGASYLKKMARTTVGNERSSVRGSEIVGGFRSDVGSYREREHYNEAFVSAYAGEYGAHHWMAPTARSAEDRDGNLRNFTQDTSCDQFIAAQMQADEDAAAAACMAAVEMPLRYPMASENGEDSEISLIVPRVSAELPSQLYPEAGEQLGAFGMGSRHDRSK